MEFCEGMKLYIKIITNVHCQSFEYSVALKASESPEPLIPVLMFFVMVLVMKPGLGQYKSVAAISVI